MNRGLEYVQARRLTEEYYQEIVLTDLLPAYVGRRVITRFLSRSASGGYVVSTPDFPTADFTPLEFSVGAYRFGQSLVRQHLDVNNFRQEI